MSWKDDKPTDGPLACLWELHRIDVWVRNFDGQMLRMDDPHIGRRDWIDGVQAALISMDQRLQALEAKK